MTAKTSHSDGPMMVELKRVHGMIRTDLEAARELARRARAGEDPAAMREGVEALRKSGMLWMLRTNCLKHCEFVHRHHVGEDEQLFPMLLREDPGLGPVVDRLQADHRRVSDLLDQVERAARGALDTNEHVRDRLASALDELASHLHEHLAYEERAIAPVLNRWTEWPRP